MAESPRLSGNARSLIVNAEEVYVSSASIWEIAIKSQLGKLQEDAELIAGQLEAAGLRELQVANRHAVAVGKLPPLHSDPFDRLLVAQALSEPMRLLTADTKLTPYTDLVIQV